MIATTLWFVALLGGIATLGSVTMVAGLSRLRVLDRMHPRTRARVYTWSTLFPLALAVFVGVAILMPQTWLGLPDHCLVHANHLHVCLSCGLTPPAGVTVVAALYGVWAVFGVLRVARRMVRARRALSRMERVATRRAHPGVVELPAAEPIAFAAGFLRPKVFVSEPVTEERWSAVLAHEHDHALHRDPLVRLLARFALAFHPPGVAAWLEARIVKSQELAADEAAAAAVGDRLEVAQQVLAWVRVRKGSAEPAFAAFGESDLNERIRVLMDPPRYVRGPSPVEISVALGLAVTLVAVFSPSIHHGVEEIVHLLPHSH